MKKIIPVKKQLMQLLKESLWLIRIWKKMPLKWPWQHWSFNQVNWNSTYSPCIGGYLFLPDSCLLFPFSNHFDVLRTTAWSTSHKRSVGTKYSNKNENLSYISLDCFFINSVVNLELQSGMSSCIRQHLCTKISSPKPGRVLTIYMEKLEILVGKSSSLLCSVWEALENMGCNLKRSIFLLF